MAGDRSNISFRGRQVRINAPLSFLSPPAPYLMEDFLHDALADSPYVTVTQSGTPTTAAAISGSAGDPVAGHGGWLAGSVDNVDAEIDEVAVGGLAASGSAWQAQAVGAGGVLIVEWGITVPTALTARQYFAGFSDDPTEGTTTNGALNIQTGYTLVDPADDAAGWIFSSLATAPTKWKFGSTDSGTGSSMAAANEYSVAQVADTAICLRVEVDVNGDAYGMIRPKRGGSLAGEVIKSNVGLSPDVALVPLFTAAATTTTAVPWEIDYAFVASSHAF